MTIYFAAGGLLGTAWVNTLQLVVMLVGLRRRRCRSCSARVGGLGGAHGRGAAAAVHRLHLFGRTRLRLDAPRADRAGVRHLAGADSEGVRRGERARAAHRRRAERRGAAAVRVRAGAARHGRPRGAARPSPSRICVLPDACCTQLLPAWLGALALAAVFSTEVDTCDAHPLHAVDVGVEGPLQAVSSSLARPIAQLLRVARIAAVVGGVARRAAVDLPADRRSAR